MECPKCGKRVETDCAFCQECGLSMSDIKNRVLRSEPDIFDGVEQSIFFRVTRGFAWSILSIAVVALIITLICLIPSIFVLYAGPTSITRDEISRAIALEKPKEQVTPNTDQTRSIESKAMVKLDQEIYELIMLFPEEFRLREGGPVELRNSVKNILNGTRKEVGEKIQIIQDAKTQIRTFLESERPQAFLNFIKIKIDKETSRHQKIETAKSNLSSLSLKILFMLSLITLVTIILILLTIERNTRKIFVGRQQ